MIATTGPNKTGHGSAQRLAQPYRMPDPANPATYWGVRTHSWHVDSIPMPHGQQLKQLSRIIWSKWFTADRLSTWEDVDILVERIGEAIAFAPAAVDMSFFVDDGGNTTRTAELTRSTAWVGDDYDDCFLRFSESRTAGHGGGALRTSIDGKGFALELTRHPDSTDPCDVVTLFVFQPQRFEDARYPWVKPHGARIFDMRGYGAVPYFAGPLYNGFPSRVMDPALISDIAHATRYLLRQLLA